MSSLSRGVLDGAIGIVATTITNCIFRNLLTSQLPEQDDMPRVVVLEGAWIVGLCAWDDFFSCSPVRGVMPCLFFVWLLLFSFICLCSWRRRCSSSLRDAVAADAQLHLHAVPSGARWSPGPRARLLDDLAAVQPRDRRLRVPR